MAVTPDTLERPERDLGVQSAEADLELSGREAPAAQAPGDGLVARVRALLAAPPDSQGVACRACFLRGSIAVLDAIDVDRPDLQDQIAALWTTYPRDAAPHQAASYRAGVETVLQALAE